MGLKVLWGRSDVSSNPYTLKAFRLTIRFWVLKGGENGKKFLMDEPSTHYLGKGGP